MPDNPEVPDIKKALENKPAGFAWTPAGTGAKSAASTAGAASPSRTRTGKGPGKAVIIAGLLTASGLVLSYAAFRFAGMSDSGGGSSMGGISSSMKIRFSRQKDPTDRIIREQSANPEKMSLDLVKGAQGLVPAGNAADGKGGPGENGGGAPMNYEQGTVPNGGSAGSAGGGAAGAGQGGNQDSAGNLGNSGAAKIGLIGSVKFRGMQRVSATAGFRGIGARGGASKSIHKTGSSANNSGAATKANGTTAHLDASGGQTQGGGAGAGSGQGSNDTAAGGGADASGGGGGGPGEFDTSGIENTQDGPAKVASLMADANRLHEKSEDEKKKAIALAALGQGPQSTYHYMQSEKANKAAKAKEEEANMNLAAMNAAATAAAVDQSPKPQTSPQPQPAPKPSTLHQR